MKYFSKLYVIERAPGQKKTGVGMELVTALGVVLIGVVLWMMWGSR